MANLELIMSLIVALAFVGQTHQSETKLLQTQKNLQPIPLFSLPAISQRDAREFNRTVGEFVKTALMQVLENFLIF